MTDDSAGAATPTGTRGDAALLLDRLVANAPVGIALFDRERRFVQTNPCLAAATGRPVEALLGRALREALPDLAERVEPVLQQVLASGEPVLDIELPGFGTTDPTQQRLWLTNWYPIRDHTGTLLGAGVVVTEITERKRIEHERARYLAAERQARAAAETAHQRLAFLAAVSEALAGSLDYETTLAGVARLAVPQLADWCAIDLLEENGAIRRLTAAHADPARIGLARELDAHYPPSQRSAPAQVAQTGAAVVQPVVTDNDLVAIARDPEHLRLLRHLGISSLLVMPLQAHQRIIGALMLVSSTPGRYSEDDLPLVEDLARRVAVAVENTRLYEEARAAESRQRRLTAQAAALAEASRAFAAAQPSLEEVLTTLTTAATTLLGDVCILRLLTDDGQWLRPVAIAHRDAARLPVLREVLAEAPTRLGHGLTGQAAATGEPIFLADALATALRPQIKPHFLPYLDRFGISSMLIVPLKARGRVIGTIYCSRDAEGPLYTDEDRDFCFALADRAAIAVDNARLFQEARDAVAARDQFLSVASHELRTPVTSIKGYVQLLRRQLDRAEVDPVRLRRALVTIDEGAERLTRLIGDLLDLSRLRLGQFALRHQPLDLAELIDTIAARVRDQLADGHQLQIGPLSRPCLIIGDADRLDQVLTNLLDNAAKYSPAGGVIGITMDGESDGVCVRVRDEGIGLPAAALETIFEPFNRAPNALDSQLPGLGLGLAICRDIVTRHGGRLWAESAGEGRGATFLLWLPLAAGSGAPASA
ncbi:MAG: GAF domain-containing protein [Thermomicrobiales bacterium]